MSEHYYDGTRQHDSASYEGTVYACGCGERFVDRNELMDHVEDMQWEEQAEAERAYWRALTRES